MWDFLLKVFGGLAALHILSAMLQRLFPAVFGADVGYRVIDLPTRLLPVCREENSTHIQKTLMIDGECVMCNATAKWVFAQNQPKAAASDAKSLAFVSLTSSEGLAVRRYFPHLKNVDSIIFIEPHTQQLPHTKVAEGEEPPRISADAKTKCTVTCKSRGPLRVAMNLDSILFVGLAYVAYYLIPPMIRDIVYDFIGRNRYRWFGKKEDLSAADGTGCVRKGTGFTTRIYSVDYQDLVEEAKKHGEEPPSEPKGTTKKKVKKATSSGGMDYFSAAPAATGDAKPEEKKKKAPVDYFGTGSSKKED